MDRDESGNGKIPYRPTPYSEYTARIPNWREKQEQENSQEIWSGTGTEVVEAFFHPYFRFPYSAGKIPTGIPVPLPHFGPFDHFFRSPAAHISRPPPHSLSLISPAVPQTAVSHSRTLARRSPRSPAPPFGRPPVVPLGPSDRRPVPRRPLTVLARSALQQSLPPSPSDRRPALRRPPTGERR